MPDMLSNQIGYANNITGSASCTLDLFGNIDSTSGDNGVSIGVGMGPAVIASNISGIGLFPSSDAGWPPTGSPGYQWVNFDEYSSNNSRLIGFAFEVHNVTAEIYQQGTVTVGRQPQSIAPGNHAVTYDVVTLANAQRSSAHEDDSRGQSDVRRLIKEFGNQKLAETRFGDPKLASKFQSNTPSASKETSYVGELSVAPLWSMNSYVPPANVQDLMNIPTSRQWKAAYGAYCVDTFNHELNPPQPFKYGRRGFFEGDPDPTSTTSKVAGWTVGNVYNGVDGFTGGAYPSTMPMKPVPKDSSIAWFTGLSPQTTLTVTFVAIIEEFPPSFNHKDANLSRPTPPYDPMFFALYKKVAQALPPGVMVAENASGDFWDRVLGAISTAAPSLMSLVPGLGSFSPMAQGGLKMIQDYRNTPSSSTSDQRKGTTTPSAQAKQVKAAKTNAKNLANRSNSSARQVVTGRSSTMQSGKTRKTKLN
jgi:hypothetical protein